MTKENASLHISADTAACTERYLAFQNLWYDGTGISDVIVSDEHSYRQFQVRGFLQGQYSGIHDLMCNLGYRENNSTGYTVSFGGVGTYTFDNMEIVDQPVSELANLTKQRRNDPVRYAVGEDAVMIEVESDAPEIVYAAIPYGKRWKAYVDGAKAECLRANGFGTGVLVGAGKHRIALRYE